MNEQPDSANQDAPIATEPTVSVAPSPATQGLTPPAQTTPVIQAPPTKLRLPLIALVGIAAIIVAGGFSAYVLLGINKKSTDTATQGSGYTNDCYRFKTDGLKKDGNDSSVKYKCESAFVLDNDGYFRTVKIFAYQTYTGGFAASVEANAKEFESEGYSLKRSQIQIDGAPAVRFDLTKAYSSNTATVQNETQQASSKYYFILVDAAGKLPQGVDLVGFTIEGSLNSSLQEQALRSVLESWKWQ